MKYAEISKETIQLLYQSRSSLNQSPLSATMRVLTELRVSQINECVYCCTLHTHEARKLGISQDKLDLLPVWHTSIIFTPEERLVLGWTEALTHLNVSVIQELREQLKAHFSERELVDLTACVSIMNAINRIAISLRD